ncbi:UNKNOWN [Stylonychia lemnae]|uniref:Uncharacterized protein n=1 Tax=Stylonychia lemnae TaxID=5949 RepID=A0A078A6V2_STYLE|nr:UNKNOWN [Stylonychia lemnae]|eukprot:CDW77980.1 UNKNOWN [Stylonychia lemnae]
MNNTLEYLFKQSKFNDKEKEAFKANLEQRLSLDNHDLALEEKMNIVMTCFEKNVNSVIMQIPDLEELFAFKKCVRKYSRVKMRAATYYNSVLHSEEDHFARNVDLLKPYLIQGQQII